MRHHRKIAAAAVGVLLTSASPASALFGIGDVVWDPAAEIKNVAKIAAMLDELQQMRRQYEQLRQQIEDLSGLLDDPGGDAFDRAGDALDALTQLDSTLDDWRERLPIDVEPDDIARGDMPAHQSQVRAYLRERIARADTALATVEAERDRVSAEVSSLVSASNDAPGPKAAQQAANQLQAVMTAERAKLQALRAMRHRLQADIDAARQATQAAIDADLRRDRDETRSLIDAPPTSPTRR